MHYRGVRNWPPAWTRLRGGVDRQPKAKPARCARCGPRRFSSRRSIDFLSSLSSRARFTWLSVVRRPGFLSPGGAAAEGTLRPLDRIHRRPRCKLHAVNSPAGYSSPRAAVSLRIGPKSNIQPRLHSIEIEIERRPMCESRRRRTFPGKGKGVANESDDRSGIDAIGAVNRPIRSHRMLRGSGAVLRVRVRLRVLSLLLLPGLPELLSVLLPAVSITQWTFVTRRPFDTCLRWRTRQP
jgi:hypothetical protein